MKQNEQAAEVMVWVFAEADESPDQGFWKKFQSVEACEAWLSSLAEEGILFPVSAPVSVGAKPQRFYRCGGLPANWISYNGRDQHGEGGVSCYRVPEANSFAGLADRPWYSGIGIEVGTGSDGEPVVIPVAGTWKKIK